MISGEAPLDFSKVEWLSWMRGLKIHSAATYAGKGDEPAAELRKPDRRPELPRIVESEDLTKAIDKKSAKRGCVWIQPRKDDPSKIEESWFASSNGVVALCEPDGTLLHRYARRLSEGEDERVIAKELLR